MDIITRLHEYGRGGGGDDDDDDDKGTEGGKKGAEITDSEEIHSFSLTNQMYFDDLRFPRKTFDQNYFVHSESDVVTLKSQLKMMNFLRSELPEALASSGFSPAKSTRESIVKLLSSILNYHGLKEPVILSK